MNPDPRMWNDRNSRMWYPVAGTVILEAPRVDVFGIFWPFTPQASFPRRCSEQDYVFTTGLRKGSREARMWFTWAARCCRGWNALILAGNLTGLDPYAPPGILADALEDVQFQCPLAKFIRDEFLTLFIPSTFSNRGRGLPELPRVVPHRAAGTEWV